MTVKGDLPEELKGALERSSREEKEIIGALARGGLSPRAREIMVRICEEDRAVLDALARK